MRSRCVSLTGATGFLGHRIIAAFHAAGWRVRGIVRPGSHKPVLSPAERVEASLQDVPALAAAMAGSDVVVHAAGLVRAPHGRAFETANVDGTRAVVTAVNAIGARLVHISSLAAIGPSTRARPVLEDDPPHPVNAYGRSKLAAETVVRSLARGPWIMLRPCAVYGPADRGFLPLVRMARRGLFPLAAPADMPFTFIYADDVATAVRQAAESAISKDVLFIGHAAPESAGSMLRTIAGALQRTYRPIPVPTLAVRLAGRVGDLVWAFGGTPLLDSSRVAEFTATAFACDVSRATARLGFTAAVDLTEGIPRTVRWYRDQGWI